MMQKSAETDQDLETRAAGPCTVIGLHQFARSLFMIVQPRISKVMHATQGVCAVSSVLNSGDGKIGENKVAAEGSYKVCG